MERVIRLRLAVLFLEKFAEAAIFPFMALRFAETLGTGTAGLLMFTAFAAATLAGIWAGHLADTLGRRRVLVPAEIGRAIAAAALALAILPETTAMAGPVAAWAGFPPFLALAIAAGVSTPTAEATVIDLATPERRTRIYGAVYWITNVARSSGTLAGAALYAAAFGWLLAGIAVLAAGVAIALMLWLVETRPEAVRAAASHGRFHPGALIAGYLVVLRDRLFLRYALGVSLSLAVAAQLAHYVAVRLGTTVEMAVLVDAAGWRLALNGPELFGLLRIENGLMVVALAPLVQRLARPMTDRRRLIIGFTLFAIGFWVLGWSTAPWLLILFTALFTIGELLYAPPKLALMAALAPQAARSRAAAVMGLGFRGALMTGALGVAAVGHVDPQVMALVFVAGAALAGWLLVDVSRKAEGR
ncbi:MFS transporter [Tistrella bauzanensis]|uniref:MFS transporter n=1 Tax=Tistrella bauzanensis TaxID=657419 RepID=A0ABQ1J481_9PROT|nr:MFS transporter [Tistrella bauzanensis]GGB57630.1 MFS transporter [Tistrella bauzanensis]